MTKKIKMIVLDNEDFLDDFDIYSLNFAHKSDVKNIKGVIFKDTMECVEYLPVFYYDTDGFIIGFEGWGGSTKSLGKLSEKVDFTDKTVIDAAILKNVDKTKKIRV